MTSPSGVSKVFVAGYLFAIPVVCGWAGMTMSAVLVVMIRPHSAIVPAIPGESSTTNNCQSPFGLRPLNTLRLVVVRLPGPGAGQLSVVLK